MSGVLDTFTKQPNEVEDFGISFVRWLAERDDTIAELAVDADPGITVDFSQEIDGVVKVWLSGGTDGQRYKVTATVTTTEGRVKEAEIYVRVKEI